MRMVFINNLTGAVSREISSTTKQKEGDCTMKRIVKIVKEIVVEEDTWTLLQESKQERESFLSAITTDMSMDDFELKFSNEVIR